MFTLFTVATLVHCSELNWHVRWSQHTIRCQRLPPRLQLSSALLPIAKTAAHKELRSGRGKQQRMILLKPTQQSTQNATKHFICRENTVDVRVQLWDQTNRFLGVLIFFSAKVPPGISFNFWNIHTAIQNFGVKKIFKKCIKSNSTAFYNVIHLLYICNTSYLYFKLIAIFWTFHSSKKVSKKIMQHNCC